MLISLGMILFPLQIMKYLSFKIGILLLLTSLVRSALVPLTQEIGTSIFGQNATYIIYVCRQPSPKVEETLNKYCQEKQCAILHDGIQEAEMVRSFVGLDEEEYLLILDVGNRRKFTKTIKQSSLTEIQVKQFHEGYLGGTLKRHLATEPVPQIQQFSSITHLVGSTISEFLDSPTPLKLIFLYTASQLCDTCPSLFSGLVELADKVARKDVIAFGYVDIFRNDHEQISIEQVPKLMLWENNKKGRVIEMENAAQLEQIIKNIINSKQNGDQGETYDEESEDTEEL